MPKINFVLEKCYMYKFEEKGEVEVRNRKIEEYWIKYKIF